MKNEAKFLGPRIMKTGSASSKIRQKYQITIPREIRKEWKVKVGDTVMFKKEEVGVNMETYDEYIKKYFGLFAGRGHSVRDLKEARKTMWLRK